MFHFLTLFLCYGVVHKKLSSVCILQCASIVYLITSPFCWPYAVPVSSRLVQELSSYLSSMNIVPTFLCILQFCYLSWIYLILLSFTVELMVSWLNIQLLHCIYAMVAFHHPCCPSCDIIISQTPCSRVILKKLIVAQVVKNFPTLCGTWRFITLFPRTHYWFLSWVTSIQTILTAYFKVYFNIILLTTSSSYYLSFPFSFSDQNFVSIAALVSFIYKC